MSLVSKMLDAGVDTEQKLEQAIKANEQLERENALFASHLERAGIEADLDDKTELPDEGAPRHTKRAGGKRRAGGTRATATLRAAGVDATDTCTSGRSSPGRRQAAAGERERQGQEEE